MSWAHRSMGAFTTALSLPPGRPGPLAGRPAAAMPFLFLARPAVADRGHRDACDFRVGFHGGFVTVGRPTGGRWMDRYVCCGGRLVNTARMEVPAGRARTSLQAVLTGLVPHHGS